jgi:lipopolysaccharide/colanic/teichoic acid biosynthesis glycosyltransferase
MELESAIPVSSTAPPRTADNVECAGGGALKRVVDVTVATLVLLTFIPVFVVIAAVILLESPGPLFYRAERVGRGGRTLLMLKFRKMVANAEGAALTADGDPRLTRGGAFLHRSRLDELPQLWHVLRGDMSLVGPRPEAPCFVAMHAESYAEILTARPGLTGWTQLAFADERRILSPDDPQRHYVEAILPQKVELDRLYVGSPSLRRDARIALWTIVAVVLRQPVAVNRATGALTLRRR